MTDECAPRTYQEMLASVFYASSQNPVEESGDGGEIYITHERSCQPAHELLDEVAVEEADVAAHLDSGAPVVWWDSGFEDNVLAHGSLDAVRRRLHEYSTAKGLAFPRANILASSDGLVAWYETGEFDVVTKAGRPKFVHFKNRSRVRRFPGFVPIHREVVLHGEQNGDVAFDLLVDALPEAEPMFVKGEKRFMKMCDGAGTGEHGTDKAAKGGALAAALSPAAAPRAFAAGGAAGRIVSLCLFLSMAGAATNLHFDEVAAGVDGIILCQLSGRKRLYFWRPDEDDAIMQRHATPPDHPWRRQSRAHFGRDPWMVEGEAGAALRGAINRSILIQPGQCASIPPRWWHYTDTLDDATVSFRFHWAGKSKRRKGGNVQSKTRTKPATKF